jgi:DNA-binding MarR family transcriptional regulator
MSRARGPLVKCRSIRLASEMLQRANCTRADLRKARRMTDLCSLAKTGRSTDAEKTAERLHAAAILLLRRLRQADTASGLNGPRLSALSVIVFAGPLTLGQLAEAEQVRPPTMTRIVQALAAMGLVRKVVNPEDRRTIHLAGTMKGKRVMLEARARRIRPLAEGIARLGREEREALQKAVGVMERLGREGRSTGLRLRA